MAERKLVVMLGPEGRRGTLIAHGFYAAPELEVLRSQGRAEEAAPTPTHSPSAGTGQLAALQEELQHVREEMTQLAARWRQTEEVVQELRRQVQALKEALGA